MGKGLGVEVYVEVGGISGVAVEVDVSVAPNAMGAPLLLQAVSASARVSARMVRMWFMKVLILDNERGVNGWVV